jgi:hypothetical protein
MLGDSSGSSGRSHSSSSRYDDLAALRFKTERDETQRELEAVSKKAGIDELEWEHQRKQLLETIDGRLSMMLSVVILHPLQLPAGRDLSGPHITESITWINIL